MSGLTDALKDMTRRQLEDLQVAVAKELQVCTLCNTEGAAPYRVRRSVHGSSSSAVMLFCLPCFEKHRLPESRAESQ